MGCLRGAVRRWGSWRRRWPGPVGDAWHDGGMSTTDQRAADSTGAIRLELWVDLAGSSSWRAAGRLHEAVVAFERPTDVAITLRAFERQPPSQGEVSTLDAQRLCALALALGGAALQAAAAERFWVAHFTQGLALDDPHVLQRAAAECGLDERRVASVLAGDEFAARVRADEQTARSLGIDAAPALVAGGVVVLLGSRQSADYLALLRDVATGHAR